MYFEEVGIQGESSHRSEVFETSKNRRAIKLAVFIFSV
jgi:hypothetical protein